MSSVVLMFCIYAKPWPHSNIRFCCCQSAYVLTSRYNSNLLGLVFCTPKAFLHEIVYTGLLLRLTGGSSYSEGRVEVNYNYEWGSMCDDGWDDADAGVVCRQLGIGSSGTAIKSTEFGQGSGKIWPNIVLCNGSEPNLARCGINTTTSCKHTKNARVSCRGLQDTQGAYVHRLFSYKPEYVKCV